MRSKTVIVCYYVNIMMTSWNGNVFRVTGLLCGEFTGHRWIPLTNASDAELWCFRWSAPDQTAEWKIETPVIWDALAPVMTSLWWTHNNLDMCTYILLPRDALFRDGYLYYSQKTTVIMTGRHWWHQRLSYWQPPPETTKLALWQFLDFQWVIISVIFVDL